MARLPRPFTTTMAIAPHADSALMAGLPAPAAAIATGVYGYPIDEAAEIAVHTLRTTRTSVELVRLVAFDLDNYQALSARLAETDSQDL